MNKRFEGQLSNREENYYFFIHGLPTPPGFLSVPVFIGISLRSKLLIIFLRALRIKCS